MLSLTTCLGIARDPRKPLVALVGGGGKTRTMWALATALAAQGQRVITATTTRLVAAQRDESVAWCVVGDEAALRRALDRHGQCLVVGTTAESGLSIEQVGTLYGRADVDAIVVEADGSRKRPLKAPAPHEPVIPPLTTHVICVIGADAFGQPLDEATVHRPERAAAVADVAPGATITPAIVARIVAAPNGGRQYVPATATFVPFINKVESSHATHLADECAALLLADPAIERVLIGSLRGTMPFVRMVLR